MTVEGLARGKSSEFRVVGMSEDAGIPEGQLRLEERAVWRSAATRRDDSSVRDVANRPPSGGDGLNLAGIGAVLQLRQETRRLAAQVGKLQAAGEPDSHEIRRLRRENHALQAELDKRDNPDRAITDGSPTGRATDDRDGEA